MSYERRDFAGAAVDTTITAGINSSATSISIADATGWPTGTNGKFLVAINRAGSTEEKILVESRSGTTLTLASAGDRGVDGTSAAAHSSGESIELVIGALDADEANYTVAETVGKVTAAGDMLVADGANSFARLAKGSDGQLLRMAAGAVGWGAIPSGAISSNAMFAAGVVDAAAIAADAVTTAKILDANVTAAKVAAETWTSWTPGLSQSGAVATSSASGDYIQLGTLVIARFALTASAAGTAGNAITVTGLPATADASGYAVGSARLSDVGTAIYGCVAYLASTTTLTFFGDNDLGALGQNPSFALASGDVITGTVTYQAA